MTKICKYCKCEFEAKHGKARYCSGECAAMAHRKHSFLKREAKAKEYGLSLDEIEDIFRRGYGRYLPEAKRLGITIWEMIKRVRAERHAITKAKDADCGMGVKEYIRIFGRHFTRNDGKRRPKTYAEIRAANRKHPIAAGWRGSPVMGGGSVRYNDGDLKQSEL